jgi:membrane protease YdiL (CAAX protease family)
MWRERVRANPVAAYFLLTFLVSWSIWGAARVLLPGASRELRAVVHTAGLCGPTVAALVLTGLLSGRRAVLDLLKRIARWRVGIGWYLFAICSTLVIGLTAIAVHALAGGMTPPRNPLVLAPALLPLPAGLPEEYGWRGFALPHLLKRRSALTSSLIIGVLWVAWHIPIAPALHSVPFFGLFLLEVIPLSVLFSWLYINSRGSILVVVLYHLAANVVVEVLNIPGSQSLWTIYVGLNWLLVAVIAAGYGVSRLSRHGRADTERDLGNA